MHFVRYALHPAGNGSRLTMTNSRPNCVVIGVGNPDRGDDAAGFAVARQLRDGIVAVRGLTPRVDPAAQPRIVEHGGEATALVLEMGGVEQVFLIDACVSGAPPGTIHRFDVSSAAMPAFASGFSTHGFGPAAAVELARALGRLPHQCIVYAIEGASFETGAPLSPPVAAAVAEVARCLRDEIAACNTGRPLDRSRSDIVSRHGTIADGADQEGDQYA
jgi:hydrogenase maturation protease